MNYQPNVLQRQTALLERLDPSVPAAAIPISLTINGQEYKRSVRSWTSLLDLLLKYLDLTGTKKGCDIANVVFHATDKRLREWPLTWISCFKADLKCLFI
jgi:hypothetical protein